MYKVTHHYELDTRPQPAVNEISSSFTKTDTNDCILLHCITLYCTVIDSCDFVLHYIYSYSKICIQPDNDQVKSSRNI